MTLTHAGRLLPLIVALFTFAGCDTRLEDTSLLEGEIGDETTPSDTADDDTTDGLARGAVSGGAFDPIVDAPDAPTGHHDFERPGTLQRLDDDRAPVGQDDVIGLPCEEGDPDAECD